MQQINKLYNDQITATWGVENLGSQPADAALEVWLIDPLLGDIVAIPGPWESVPGLDRITLMAQGQLPLPTGDYLGYAVMEDEHGTIGYQDFGLTLGV